MCKFTPVTLTHLMKTFDIALKYLKDINFKDFDVYSYGDTNIFRKERFIVEEIKKRQVKFLADKLNTKSNEHYRGICFLVCMFHLSDLSNKMASCFDIACEVIESEYGVISTPQYKKFGETIYPLIMVNKWNWYCDKIQHPPAHLKKDSEIRLDIFTTAFHYLEEDTEKAKI